MKKLIYILIVITASVMSVSCTNNKQIIEVAEKYVSEQICPFLPNASISDYAPVSPENPIIKIKGVLDRAKIVTAKETSLFDIKKIDASTENKTIDQYKNKLIIHRLIQSDIDALKKADAEQGFYVAWVNVKYDNDKYKSFDIVVSKDLEVLNMPINISEINAIVKQVEESYTD